MTTKEKIRVLQSIEQAEAASDLGQAFTAVSEALKLHAPMAVQALAQAEDGDDATSLWLMAAIHGGMILNKGAAEHDKNDNWPANKREVERNSAVVRRAMKWLGAVSRDRFYNGDTVVTPFILKSLNSFEPSNAAWRDALLKDIEALLAYAPYGWAKEVPCE